MIDLCIRLLSHPCTLLAIGGGLGVNARYWIGVWFITRGWSAHFPWHTFGINILGSFLLGVIGTVCLNDPRRTWLLLLLGTGFCGGFTTYSTFSVETLGMLKNGRLIAATAYVLGSAAAALVGAAIGVWLVPPRPNP
jgi:CrcB protein